MAKLRLVFIVLAVLCAVAAAIFALVGYGQTKKLTTTGMTFRYSKDYVSAAVPKAKVNRAKTIARFTAREPVRAIELAKEANAIIGANVTKTDFLTFLENTAERSFRVYYSGYKKKAVQRVKLDGRESSIFSFSYTGTDKKTTLYVDFYIIPMVSDAYYLTIQSAEEKALEKDSKTVQSTLSFK